MEETVDENFAKTQEDSFLFNEWGNFKQLDNKAHKFRNRTFALYKLMLSLMKCLTVCVLVQAAAAGHAEVAPHVLGRFEVQVLHNPTLHT